MHNAFVTYLRGKGPLWKVFWLYGVIPSNLLLAIILVLLNKSASTAVIDALLVVLAIYTMWIVTAVWQCAENVSNPDNARYGVLARWLTVAWAINTLMFVVFLILDLSI